MSETIALASCYATLVHELTHWTGAKHRLDREFGKRFGDQAYAAEELVAEIGAAFLCAELWITQETRPDHAQYLAQWLTLLKGDQRALFAASAKASEARRVSKGDALIKPYHQRLYDFIHGKTKAKVFMHSCGSVFDIIPDLIDVGVEELLNPIQRSAAKMDIATMKQEFGKEALCFWGGGIDVQQVLPFATHERIRDEVAYSIDTLGKDGGYVFCPAHNIQPDVSADRIDVMYRAALDHGR